MTKKWSKHDENHFDVKNTQESENDIFGFDSRRNLRPGCFKPDNAKSLPSPRMISARYVDIYLIYRLLVFKADNKYFGIYTYKEFRSFFGAWYVRRH